jgi:cytochrome c
MTQRAAASLVLLLLSAMPAFAGDPAAGELVFKRNCTICHAVGPGAANKTGPELNGIIGRKAGSAPGYNYSDANKSSGITWDEATFTKYIANPKGVVPGTKMTFPGLKNEGDIGNLVAYLQQFGPDGQPVK